MTGPRLTAGANVWRAAAVDAFGPVHEFPRAMT